MTKTDFTLEDLKREARRVIEVGESQLGFDGQSAAGPMKTEDRAYIERQLAGNKALLAALEELERRRAADEPSPTLPSCCAYIIQEGRVWHEQHCPNGYK